MSLFATPVVLATAWHNRRVLATTTMLELKKKYAGSFLGWIWIFLYPILFLLAYVLVFMVIFRLSLPGLTQFGYVAFVFSGLVPFLTLTEVVNVSAVVIRQNIHFLKNVILPLEFVPLRVALAAMIVQMTGLLLMFVILGFDAALSWKLLLLPVVLVFAFFFYTGLAMVLAPLGMILPDLAHGIGILMNLLMFISPIAFKRDQVPGLVKALVDFNPAAYLIEAYRAVLIPAHQPDFVKIAIFAAMSLIVFELGARLLLRYKSSIVDYE